LQWDADGAGGHGERLARELGYTPVYLRYNSGQHVSVNGRQFAELLEQLCAAWPWPVQQLGLLTHSMGGLVARSACHHAERAGHSWRGKLDKLVFLGTPHHGAPLEMLGNWVDGVLGGIGVLRPFAGIGQIRSAGITDLRHGYLHDADWADRDRFERAPDRRAPLPLPEGVACFTVAATTLAEPAQGLASLQAQIANQLIGDGLVPLPSALGQHADALFSLQFAEQQQFIAWRTGHLALLSSPAVASQLRRWFAG
jgi:alpha-beta hydrolase superfamily lysophospholipase